MDRSTAPAPTPATTSRGAVSAPSHVYYFEVGPGTWQGTFTFRVTDWRGLAGSGVGLRNLLLVLAMVLAQRLTGPARLTSTIVARPGEGPFGAADNAVRLSRFAITLYDLRERYELDPDGTSVLVRAAERFGPVPKVLTRSFTYPAKIREAGMASTYHMPLLGAPWTASYQVSADRTGLAGTLACRWATATEDATQVSSPARAAPA